MKKYTRIFISIIEIIVVIYVISIASLILFRNKYGFTQFGNKTFINIDSSMKDTVRNARYGDLVIVKSGEKIKNKDIIYYYTIEEEDYIVGSGKVRKVNDNSYIVEDNIVIDESRLIGKENVNIHYLGSVISFIETKKGFVLCVLLPIIIVFIVEIFMFFSSFKRKNKSNIEEIEILEYDNFDIKKKKKNKKKKKRKKNRRK